MGTLLPTIIRNTSRKPRLSVPSIGMKLFIVLTTLTIITIKIEADCIFRNNSYIAGQDVHEYFLDTNGPFDCNDKCVADSECVAWHIYTGPNTCALFKDAKVTSPSDGVITGEWCPECKVYDNIYIPRGSNVPGGASLPSNGPFDCNLLCQKYPECVAWTMKKATNGCWLKTVAEFTGNSDGWISGVRC